MRILFYLLFFIFVQVVASQYALARSNPKRGPASVYESKRRAEHNKTVAALREAKKAQKNKSANLPPTFDDQEETLAEYTERIVFSEGTGE